MAQTNQTNNVKELIATLFEGMDGFVATKTVVGEPVQVGDATLIPLIEVSCGMGAGGFAQDKEKKNGNAGAGAMSSKISPSAVLILQDGKSKLVHIQKQDSISKILDMIPDLVDKFTGGSRVSKKAEEAAQELLETEGEQAL